MKKRLVMTLAFLVLCMVVLLGACNRENGRLPSSPKTLLEHGQDVIAMMDEMAGSESYRQAVGGSDELKQVMQSLGNHGQPLAVYKITLPDILVASYFGIDTSDWSDALKQNMRSRTASMIINQLNGSMGVAKLTAASACTGQKTFVSEDVTAPVTYLYVYGGATPAAVTFMPGEDGAVMASGVFVFTDSLPTGSLEEVKELFAPYSATVEQVTE